MPGYISEITYEGPNSADFIEISVPAGTDVSGYSVAIYDSNGILLGTFSLGSLQSTNVGSDVYVVDKSAPGFTGIDTDYSIALINDLGGVEQFVSFENHVVTALDGPAAGETSTNIGTADVGESLESTDGGVFYVSTTPSSGTIPCYAPGTMIDTPGGARAVETLVPGDSMMTLDHGPQPIIWLRAGVQPLDSVADDNRPVLIPAGALGPDRPVHDLIISPQHRILVGALGQLDGLGDGQAFAPAKALTGLPHIRVMREKTEITWIHFACAHHEVIFANGCASESLLLGRMVLNALSSYQRRALHRLFGPQAAPDASLNGPPARPCMTVGAVENLLCNYSDPGRAAA